MLIRVLLIQGYEAIVSINRPTRDLTVVSRNVELYAVCFMIGTSLLRIAVLKIVPLQQSCTGSLGQRRALIQLLDGCQKVPV